MLDGGPSTVDIAIITGACGGLWTLFYYTQEMTKERRKETQDLRDRVALIERYFMKIDRFEQLEERLYQGLNDVRQRLDDVIQSLIDTKTIR